MSITGYTYRPVFTGTATTPGWTSASGGTFYYMPSGWPSSTIQPMEEERDEILDKLFQWDIDE